MSTERVFRFITSGDGVKIATATSGRGPVLIKAATWLTDIEQAPPGSLHAAQIDEFSRNHTYIEYDTRGCGLSQRRVDDISFEAWVRDLEAVADAYGAERFALLAFTCAVGVAVEYAARHPERVSHLILYGGFATSYHSTSHPDPAIRQEGDLMLQLAEVGWGSDLQAFRRVFASRLLPDAGVDQWDAFDRLQRETATPDVAVRHLRAMYAMNVKEAATRVRCPTLVTHAKDDEMVKFQQGLRLASLIPGARFVPLEGRNHMPFADEASWSGLVKEARRFLGTATDERPPTEKRQPPQLTPRQSEVLAHIVHGETDKQIARALDLSPRTVQMHVARLIRTLGCRNRTEAVHRASSHQFLDS